MGSSGPEEDEMTPEYVLFDHSRDIADQVAEWLAEPTAKRWHRLGCEAIGKKIASR